MRIRHISIDWFEINKLNCHVMLDTGDSIGHIASGCNSVEEVVIVIETNLGVKKTTTAVDINKRDLQSVFCSLSSLKRSKTTSSKCIHV